MASNRRFPFHFDSRAVPLLAIAGMTRRSCWIDVGRDTIYVHAGFAFRARIPRSNVIDASLIAGRFWLTLGVHTSFRGRWIVNTSTSQLVALELSAPTRAWMLGISIRVRSLVLSPEEPTAFLRALRE